MSKRVCVVVGIGGMGRAIVRRLDPGAHIVVADYDTVTLTSVEGALRDEGYDVTARRVDVAEPDDVTDLAEFAASLGAVSTVVHTAGVSGVQADPQTVLRVDLLGVALAIDAFGRVIAPGGAGVVIASMAAQTIPALADDDMLQLATEPAGELLSLPVVTSQTFERAEQAYSFAKLANLARVRSGSVSWGRRGARLNSVSPGFIATPMGLAELAGPHGHAMRSMVSTSNAQRVGTPSDIANAVEFLVGQASTYISGIDLIVDGGVVAALKSGVDVFGKDG